MKCNKDNKDDTRNFQTIELLLYILDDVNTIFQSIHSPTLIRCINPREKENMSQKD